MAYVREKNGFDLGEIDAPRDINLRGCVLSDVDIRQRHLRCFERQGYGIPRYLIPQNQGFKPFLRILIDFLVGH